jgi:homoserine O-succinyltransferase
MSAPGRFRLAVLNVMPQAEVYLDYIGSVVPAETDLVWIRLRGHEYRSSNQDVLARTHRFYDEADIADVDALLLSGSVMDRDPDFTAARYWDEVVGTLRDASTRVGSVAGVCWGAQVVAKVFFGIGKRHFPQKLSGVFEMTNLQPGHALMRGLDDRYWLPQSRYAEMEPDALASAVTEGTLVPLDWSQDGGHATVVSADGAFLMLQGHQDYPTGRLAMEYHDAVARGENPPVPVNYDPDRPVNRWRANNRAFVSAWLQQAAARKRDRVAPGAGVPVPLSRS